MKGHAILQRIYNGDKEKIQYLKGFFIKRNQEPLANVFLILGTQHPLVNGSPICSNEGTLCFPAFNKSASIMIPLLKFVFSQVRDVAYELLVQV